MDNIDSRLEDAGRAFLGAAWDRLLKERVVPPPTFTRIFRSDATTSGVPSARWPSTGHSKKRSSLLILASTQVGHWPSANSLLD
ncbi:hypothetical protein [Streptomyces malaysiensis]|uniref:Uncharacterized protein n=1 Tax=Streptomyces malaysiensis subsp. samsunensis TaxID=459658 RepID=A0A9X2LZ86_STRMQ|nr:hypothetical protein [Streptomyces samsunensis]MCQ8832432.1 hypothetical protein [Streptomyces samsunensis]